MINNAISMFFYFVVLAASLVIIAPVVKKYSIWFFDYFGAGRILTWIFVACFVCISILAVMPNV